MKSSVLLALLLSCGAALAQQQEIQRALVERDQQSAEFAAQLRGTADLGALQALHATQLREAMQPSSFDPELAKVLLPYQRERMAQERELRLAPPVVREPAGLPASPLPLPGGLPAGVDPVAPDRLAR